MKHVIKNQEQKEEEIVEWSLHQFPYGEVGLLANGILMVEINSKRVVIFENDFNTLDLDVKLIS